ncbi:MAG: thiazole synthase [Planctomycetota bacterium]|jgi:thiazole synthase|nr:thiazole synthase [Planctomycetota bacterium]
MEPLRIRDHEFSSRLFVGSGKYADYDAMLKAWEASGTQCVTVALRRVDLDHEKEERNLIDVIDRKRYTILPNTAGCYTADDALRTARLARELGLGELIKLEVIADERTLLPNTAATVGATKILADEGFTVLAYTNDDPVAARKLEEAGAAAVMPLGAPIGSGLGILNPTNIRIILDRANVPIVVDAGVGTASDVAVAMELGADAVLLNTGIALADDPVSMARAMGLACEAGRLAYLSGRMPKREFAAPSSPRQGRFTE